MGSKERPGAVAPQTLTCPQCGTTHAVNVTELRTFSRSLTATCPCGAQWTVPLGPARFPIKPVALAGYLFPAFPDACPQPIRIRGLSLEGMIFHVKSVLDAATDPTLAVGEHYRVAVTLDDAARTSLVVPIRIGHVYGKTIGAVFADDMPYSHELDFYLTS